MSELPLKFFRQAMDEESNLLVPMNRVICNFLNLESIGVEVEFFDVNRDLKPCTLR